MAQITKLADRKYVVRVSKGSGKSRTQISRVIRGTREEATKWANKQETALDICEVVDIQLKVMDFLQDWLTNVIITKVRVSTLSSYKDMLRVHVLPVIGKHRLFDLKAYQVQKIYTEMGKKNLSARTIQYTHSVLRSALNYAVKKEMIPSNPALKCDLPKNVRKEKSVLTVLQAKKFIEKSRTVKNGLICEFLLVTGLRPSECFGLKWSDIDFANNSVSISRSVVSREDGSGGFDFNPPKTPRSHRRLPLPADIIKRLKDHKRIQNAQIISKGPEYHRLDIVFASEVGTPIRHRNFRDRTFQKVLDLAGIGGEITPYSLRHSFATLMLTNNENIKIIQEFLGHSSIAITADTYSHVTPMMKQSASENLQNLLG